MAELLTIFKKKLQEAGNLLKPFGQQVKAAGQVFTTSDPYIQNEDMRARQEAVSKLTVPVKTAVKAAETVLRLPGGSEFIPEKSKAPVGKLLAPFFQVKPDEKIASLERAKNLTKANPALQYVGSKQANEAVNKLAPRDRADYQALIDDKKEQMQNIALGATTGMKVVGPAKQAVGNAVKGVVPKVKETVEQAVARTTNKAQPKLAPIETAINKGDYDTALDLASKLPKEDPYRDTIIKTFSKFSTKKPAPVPTFDDAAKHIEQQVNNKGDSIRGGFIHAAKDFKDTLKEKLVDSFSPLEDAINAAEKAGKYKLLPTQDPRLLRNRVLGAEGIAKQALKQDLEPVIKQVGSKNLDEFDRYLTARQVVDVNDLGKETGIDAAKAKVYVQQLAPKYEEAAKQVTGYTQKILKYVADNGLIAPQTYDDLVRKYPNYVPLNRVMDDITGTVTHVPGKGVGSLGKQTVVQTLKGSTRKIESPLSSVVDKTMRAVDEVERNRVGKSIANLRNLDEFKDTIKLVPQAKGNNTISVFENGVKKYYEVPESFARVAKGLNQEHMDILTRIASIPIRTLRAGLTGLNLPFIATNVVRDQLFTAITSKNVARTSIANPYNFGKAFFDTARKGGAYDDFLASGGGNSYFFAVGRDAAKTSVKEMARGKGSKVAYTVINPTKWLSTVENAIGVSEQGTRVQQFMGTRQAMKSAGKVNPLADPNSAVLKAVQAGRENSVDFAKKGAWGKVLNSAFIYLNAGIQGSRTALRAFQVDPKGTTLKLATTVYTPIAVTTLWNNATEERRKAYADIPAYEKNRNLIILPPNPVKGEDGKYNGIKIPLPQTYLGLAIPIRAAIEHTAGADPGSIGQMLLETIGNTGPVDISSKGEFLNRIVPTTIVPVVEGATGKSLFTGFDIVPKSKQDLPAGLQTTNTTAYTVEQLGKKLNISPAHLQNYIRGYTGEVGLQVLNYMDRALNKAGIIPEDEIGGVSISDSLVKRFSKVAGGLTEDQQFKEIDKYAAEAKTRLYNNRQTNTKLVTELMALPKSQRGAKLEQFVNEGKISKDNVDQFMEIAKEQETGVTQADKYLKTVSPPERAQYVLEQLNKKKTKQEKRALLNQYAERGILSKATIDELIKLGVNTKAE